MAAMNKQQMLLRKRNNAAQAFADSGGQIQSSNNGEFYMDPKTGAMMPAGVMGGGEPNNIESYIDNILSNSGMTDGVSTRERSPSGSGTGAGKGSGQGQKGSDDATVVQDGLNKGLPLSEIAAGALGAGAAVIAMKLMKSRQKPAITGDNVTDAVEGEVMPPEQGTQLTSEQMMQGDKTIDGTFDEVLGLPPSQKALPAPDTAGDNEGTEGPIPDEVVEKGTQALPPPDQSVDQTIQAVEGGPNAKLADPMDENIAQQLAGMFAKQGKFEPPAVSPYTKGVSMSIMARVRSILAGMRP